VVHILNPEFLPRERGVIIDAVTTECEVIRKYSLSYDQSATELAGPEEPSAPRTAYTSLYQEQTVPL